jgi:hypothetical protein
MIMKHLFTWIVLMVMFLFASTLLAQDTIVAWKFPSTSADSLVDVSISINTSRYISAQYGTWGSPSYLAIVIDYTTNGSEGSPDKCAMATGWDNGADSSFWMVKLKTTGYGSLKISSKQSSGNSNPGPRDFKIQYKLSGSTIWNDITGGTVVCGNDWTSGAVDSIDLPAECNDQSSQMSIRWLMTSNTDIFGGTVDSTGISKIDDIVVTGVLLASVDINSYDDFIHIYPNPSAGSFNIENNGEVKYIRVFNTIAMCVFERETSYEKLISLSGFDTGIYFVQCTTINDKVHNYKIIVK